jgi:hypothetical protein
VVDVASELEELYVGVYVGVGVGVGATFKGAELLLVKDAGAEAVGVDEGPSPQPSSLPPVDTSSPLLQVEPEGIWHSEGRALTLSLAARGWQHSEKNAVLCWVWQLSAVYLQW